MAESVALDRYAGARALVLGGSGFLGRWLARRLTESGAILAVGVRHPETFADIAAGWKILADVHAIDAIVAGSIERVIRAIRPDIVFNAVGYGVDRTETRFDMMAAINRDLVRHIAEVTAGVNPRPEWRGRRLVHMGSALEYGIANGIVTERIDASPHTEYGRSKLGGTNALIEVSASTRLDALTARAFTIFGPGEHPGRLLPVIRSAMKAGTEVRLSAGTQRRDFAYIEDVAEGILRLGLSSGTPGEVINLATGRLTSVREFAETAAAVLGLSSERLRFGAEAIRSDEMRIDGVDVSILRERTGWALPLGLDAMLRRASAFEAGLAGN